MKPGTILVVDDHKLNLIRMGAAVKALGHEPLTADNGVEALELLASNKVDVILLDILMPEMDGFEVLKRLKDDPDLREIPTIVISSLEEEKENVAKAIELGAEDFLPNDFPPAVFRARVNSALEKKHLRDDELRIFRGVDVLTQAAKNLEGGPVNPKLLNLDVIEKQDEALHRLATVFGNMADQIYQRERRLRQQIRTLKGVILLFMVGGVFGLVVPLSKMAVEIDANPFGLAFWVNALVAAMTLPIVIYKRRAPRMTWPTIRFFVLLGVVSTLLGEVVLFFAAENLAASTLSIIIVTEGFIVFLIAAAMRIEEPKLKRLIGTAIGLVGIVAIIYSVESSEGPNTWLWALVALGIPLGYAFEDLMIAARKPDDVDTLSVVAFSSLAGALFLLGCTMAFDDFVTLSISPGRLEVAVILIALTTAVGTFLFVKLIETSGAVFASQSAYVMTFSGIAWSIMLLGESLSPLSWAALALIVVGLLLVEPREEADPDLETLSN